MASTKNHPFHIVDPSPWPFVMSIAIFLMLMGVIFYARSITPLVFYGGLGLVLFTLYAWWRDIVRESRTDHHNETVRYGFRWGMVLFIASEVMFFVAFFWAYFNAALMPNEAMGNVWPPKSIETLNPWDLPYFNTLLLLLSGTTITWAHDAIVKGDMEETKKLTAITIGIGLLFLCVQMYEYSHATFAFSGGIYPSVFYMATGFHGFHVFVGICFLSVVCYRTKKGHFTKDDHFGFDAAAWYWHFVDAVWLFLFVAIYWWGA